MYTLQNLKMLIRGGGNIQLPLVLKYKSTDFIATEYTRGICKALGAEMLRVDNIDDIPSGNVFFDDKSVYFYHESGKLNKPIDLLRDIIIITKDISKDMADYYKDYVVEVPDPTSDQVVDFIKIRCPGLDKDYIEWLADMYEMQITKLSEELDKISIFPESVQNEIFEGMFEEDQIDIPDNDTTSFKIAAALENGDTTTLVPILSNMDTHRAEYGALLSLLHSGFSNCVKVLLSQNPTSSDTGLRDGQIWAIRHAKKPYTNQQLVNDLKLICGMDNRIRSGEFPAELMLDYFIIKILGKTA